MKKEQGFTLIEIAVVLIIVGLLLGGVLKGQEIITNARIKNIENSFNSLVQAISIYQERYHALPGDDLYAKLKFKDENGAPIVVNGNGNGEIENSQEHGQFWQHLRAANLIAGSPDDDEGPLNAFGGKTEIGMKEYNFSGMFVRFTSIPSKICIIFEERYDGKKIDPQKGRIQAEENQHLIDNYDINNEVNLLFSL